MMVVVRRNGAERRDSADSMRKIRTEQIHNHGVDVDKTFGD